MASPDTQNGAQVAVRQPVALGAAQADFDSLYRLAANLSKAQLLPEPLRGKPADLLILIMYGQELGLSPIQSIQGIYVVKGKPQLSGALWLAKVREAGHRVKIEHGDNYCTTTITRGDTGEVHTETFNADDAKAAGLTSNDNYRKYPKRMYQWRSVSDCATTICPEVALGFGVAEIEQETRNAPSGPVLASVVGPSSQTAQQAAAETDAALAHTPAAQPVDAEVVPDQPAEPAGPSQEELAEAYAEMDDAGVDKPAQPAVGDTDGESDEEYQRRIWGDAYVPADEQEETPKGRGSRGGRK